MKFKILFLGLFLVAIAKAQTTIERFSFPQEGEKLKLHSGWQMKLASEVKVDGNTLSSEGTTGGQWMPAKVPGTVLTSLLMNKVYPDPEFGMNNNSIPDMYDTGRDFYTYWFVKKFDLKEVEKNKHLWLNFRGINYMADIFLNGKRVNNSTYEGMFLRHHLDITDLVKTDSTNVLAVIVYPPIYPGKPNGGQGGDGTIARNNTMQFTPGWDWIRPVRDRNTGIWDEVTLSSTGAIKLANPYLVTKVPGTREVSGKQEPAYLLSSVEVENLTDKTLHTTLESETNGKTFTKEVSLQPFEKKTVELEKQTIEDPKLWWPNTVGPHPLYDYSLKAVHHGKVSDKQTLHYGIRELSSYKDKITDGRVFCINGKKIYITGGNYITSDWLLRLTPERYEHDIRFHAEMNLRMIRVWGGALLERPEFYDLCDKYGLLVFQDLWGSGDCNGAWNDKLKLHSRARRQEYPDNHDIFLASAVDQIKMVRNHPSLCLWCGANEWPLAKDIDKKLKEEIFPELDPNRLFISYSIDPEFSGNNFGRVGDGPYTIQEKEWFFTFRHFPFNAEAGNVGSPEVESMRKMMKESDLDLFPVKGKVRSDVWTYHRDLGYDDHLERYGEVKSIEDYCRYAQLVNYDQYRTFMEARASKMWEWYSGILIWKTQNPWTALRGQMYDWFLDVNASLYGTAKGCEPLHPLYNIITKKVELVNSSLVEEKDLEVRAEVFNRQSKKMWKTSQKLSIKANEVAELFSVPVDKRLEGAYFLQLTLLKGNKEVSHNVYWLTTDKNNYRSLNELPKSRLSIRKKVEQTKDHYQVTLTMKTGSKLSFFNRIKLFDKSTGERILPVHYSDNYVSIMPNEKRVVSFDFKTNLERKNIEIVIESMTDEKQTVAL